MSISYFYQNFSFLRYLYDLARPPIAHDEIKLVQTASFSIDKVFRVCYNDLARYRVVIYVGDKQTESAVV